MCVESDKNEIRNLLKRTNFGMNWTVRGVAFLTQRAQGSFLYKCWRFLSSQSFVDNENFECLIFLPQSTLRFFFI
ncbi:hypothetical protein DM790_12295 [Flavobacterium collinsii]|jgi:hypothetical protein|nr:hypothetical protein [Flavobacterium collinsii]